MMEEPKSPEVSESVECDVGVYEDASHVGPGAEGRELGHRGGLGAGWRRGLFIRKS